MAIQANKAMFQAVFKLQCRRFLACGGLWGVVFFVSFMLGIAAGTLGWLETTEDVIRLLWLGLMPAIFVHYYVFIHDDLSRSDYFRALGCVGLYHASQACFLWLSLLPLYVLFAALAIYMGCDLTSLCEHFGLMALFEATVFGALYTVRHLIETYRLSPLLYLTIVGPWCLVTWVVAILGSSALLNGGSARLHLLILCIAAVWWCIGWTMAKK